MDITGETQRDLAHNIAKARLDQSGREIGGTHSAELRNEVDVMNDQRQEGYCGSCYGGQEPENGCCNSCEDVRQAYINKGWSFTNPDNVEQVGGLHPKLTKPLTISSSLVPTGALVR